MSAYRQRTSSHASLAFCLPRPSPCCLLLFFAFLKKLLIFVFVVLGVEPGASHMLDKFCTTDLHLQPYWRSAQPFPVSLSESLSPVALSVPLYLIYRLGPHHTMVFPSASVSLPLAWIWPHCFLANP